jgi:hypothetical protein
LCSGQVRRKQRALELRGLLGRHRLGIGVERLHGVRGGYLPGVFGRVELRRLCRRDVFCFGRERVRLLPGGHVPDRDGRVGVHKLRRRIGIDRGGRNDGRCVCGVRLGQLLSGWSGYLL